jgi:protein-disulfide isomerase-like protein with CxxC motif
LDRVTRLTYPDGRTATRAWTADGLLADIGLPGATAAPIHRTYDSMANC